MKTTTRTPRNGSAVSATPQPATETKTAPIPAEFKLVRLRECPVASAVMDCPHAVENFWRAHVVTAPWFGADKECLVVFLLDTRHQVMGFEMLSQGTKDTVLVNVAEVFRMAVLQGVAGIIVAHNHPSGNPLPSEPDIKVTRDLIRAGTMLKIELLDHVIIGTPRETGAFCQASLRALGYFYEPAGLAVGYSISAREQVAAPVVAMPSQVIEPPTRASVISESPDMEYAVYYTLGLLKLLARMNSVRTPDRGWSGCEAIGCSLWTDKIGKALHDDLAAARGAKFKKGGKVLSGGDPAGLLRRLGVTISKVKELLLVLAHDLSGDWFDEYDHAVGAGEEPPADSSPYLSMATDCVEYLEASFKADFGQGVNIAQPEAALERAVA